MENMNMLMSCRRCGKKTLMKNMRLAKNGVDMVCIDCIQKEVTLRNPGSAPAAIAPKKPVSKEPVVKYHCQDCNYKFERKASAHVDKCPYCGKSNMLVPETKLASDSIIEDSLDSRYDTPEKWGRK